MALLTTTIGGYPKPAYVPLPDWFRAPRTLDAAAPARRAATPALAGEALEEVFVRATGEAVRDQVAAGVDVPTDGEMRRENYIHYHCRHLDGIDFRRLAEKSIREGTSSTVVPTVVGPVAPRAPFLVHDWRVAQSFTERPVKITIPGPLTICDTVADAHYGDDRRLCADLAAALNAEVLALAAAGCRHIQIDEPVFARRPQAALDYGFDTLQRCLHGLPAGVVRTLHVCCGYPDRLDREDFPKAPNESYHRLADAVERAGVDAVSIEDAHRPIDLSLLERFSRTTVVLGAVAIARSRLETPEEIAARLAAALEHIDAGRLMASPDCGLALLGRELARAKLANMVAAARAVG